MNGLARLDKALKENHEENTINRGIDATLGKLLSDGSWVIDIDTRPGWVYASYNDGGRNTVVEALDSGVSRVPGMPVRLLKMNDGQFEAKAAGAKTATYNGEAARYTGNIGYHTHEPGGGLDDYVSPRRLLYGLVRATNPASMSVQIEAFDFSYGGSAAHIPRSTFDLTPYLPGTASTWQWVKVGYDPDAETFVAVEGTEVSVLTPLSEEDLPAISMTGYIPLGAVRLREDDTSIPEVDALKVARFADIRQFLGGADVLGPASTDDVPEGVTNLYFTNERAQDAVGAILLDSSSINFTYDDGANTITAVVLPAGVDHNSLANLTTGDVHTQYVALTPGSSTRNIIQPSAANFIPLIVRGFASQSVDFFDIQDSAGTRLFRYDNNQRASINRNAFSTVSIPSGVPDVSLIVGNRMLTTTAGSAITRAIWAAVQIDNGTNVVARADGLDAFVYPNGTQALTLAIGGVYAIRPLSTGAVTTALVLQSSIDGLQGSSTSAITTGYNYYANNTIGALTVTDMYLFYGVSPTKTSGAITNLYGLYLQDMSLAGTLNFAIVTNAGNIVFNEGGDANTDVRIEGDTEVNLLFTDASVDFVGIGTAAPATRLEIEETRTITGAVTDGYAGALTLDPGYTAATAQTVTRHNYIDVQNVSNAGAGPSAVTDAAVMRFDAAAGTHLAVDAATTKTTPGGVDAWMKINVNGTLHYVPSYTSKTA